METKHQVEASEIVNLLPFVSMPEQLSVVRLRTALRFKPASLDLARVGTFIHNGDEIWSFTPLPALAASLEAIMDSGLSRSRPRFEIEGAAPGRKVLSWLLRKHFERYLLRFGAQGLFIEGDPNAPRAYFHGQDGKPRTISYSTREIRARLAQRRRAALRRSPPLVQERGSRVSGDGARRRVGGGHRPLLYFHRFRRQEAASFRGANRAL